MDEWPNPANLPAYSKDKATNRELFFRCNSLQSRLYAIEEKYEKVWHYFVAKNLKSVKRFCPWDDCDFMYKTRDELYKHIVDTPHEGIAKMLVELVFGDRPV